MFIANLRGLVFCLLPLLSTSQGTYLVNATALKQVIWGIGYEIQSDSIGSGNNGLPVANTSVPNDLVPAEKTRFFTDMLRGFRYCRLALGLYFRGLDASQRHIIERWPGQAAGLAEMAQVAGIEGFDAEYWSPAPGWKDNRQYINGSLASFNASFLADFAASVVTDLQYLQSNGMSITMFGLQNEPPVGPSGCTYSCCGYSQQQYYEAFGPVAEAVKAAFPGPRTLVHADSWGGQQHASLVRDDPKTAALVDAWTWHSIGTNSDTQINQRANFNNGTLGKPVANNEYEYFQPTSDFDTINTAQSIMNWFVFEDSPFWFWLHALKPTYNSEASGYGLGFWRPWDDSNYTHFPNLQQGHWTTNPQNWNSLAGFVKYLPWDSQRVDVTEDDVRPDIRVLAYLYNPALARWKRTHEEVVSAQRRKDSIVVSTDGNHTATGYHALGIPAADAQLAFVITNRWKLTTFNSTVELAGVPASPAPRFDGFLFSPNQTDMPLGSQTAQLNTTTGRLYLSLHVRPTTIQFWVQA